MIYKINILCCRNGSILFIFLLLFYSCKPTLILTKATSQSWCIKEKNIKGVNYHILIKSNASYLDVKFDSLKSNGMLINDYNYSVLGKSIYEQKFSKEDTVLISFNRIGVEKAETITIYYSHKHSRKSIKVYNFKELRTLCP